MANPQELTREPRGGRKKFWQVLAEDINTVGVHDADVAPRLKSLKKMLNMEFSSGKKMAYSDLPETILSQRNRSDKLRSGRGAKVKKELVAAHRLHNSGQLPN